MAIRIPNLGNGDGQTGDNELKIRQDYNHNFSDQSNAASKVVGAGIGNVPVFDNNNALGAQGYIQAGINAPKIAYKKIMATYPTGDTLNIAHGITSSKILALSISARNSIGFLVAAASGITNNKFYAYEESGLITVGRVVGEDNLLAGGTIIILITYEV